MDTDFPMTIQAADGYALNATLFCATDRSRAGSIVIINGATGVKAAYYARYARFLASHGMAAITYDYRGIGASRPGTLNRFKASKYDWGSKDFEGVLRWAMEHFPHAKIAVVGHSIGGVVPGFAASNYKIDRMMTVGAQFAYWRDYAKEKRFKMFFQWHVFMPLLTMLLGYFPGRRLGWLEDLPAGVALEWAFRRSALESKLFTGLRRCRRVPDAPDIIQHFPALRCALLAYGVTDDPFGTPAAIQRLLRYYCGSDRTHVEISPASLHMPEIGHFAYFHDRFKDSLWIESLTWLTTGMLQRSPATVMPACSA